MRTLIAVSLLLLTCACGGGGGSSADTKGTAGNAGSNTPKCSEVWVDGATLPKTYEGCVRSDGDIEAAVTQKCDDGSGEFTTFQDHYFAHLGGKITKADSNSKVYSKAYNDCFAG